MKTLKFVALISSIFSVVFSLSIAIELYQTVNIYTFILISVFISFFVIYNEYSKVREIKRFFRGQKYNLITILFTFLISLLLSSVGIYFWTNKSSDNQLKIENNYKEDILSIDKKYNIKLDSIQSMPNNSKEYLSVLNDIEFWRNRKSDSKEQRQEILLNIKFLEGRRSELNNIFNERKSSIIRGLGEQKQSEIALISSIKENDVSDVNTNKILFYIFLSMVIVTEFIIVNIHRQIVNMFSEDQRAMINILKDFELRNIKKVDINEMKYSPFNPHSQSFKDKNHTDKMWTETKIMFNLFKELNIIDNSDTIVIKKPAKFIEKYFSTINNL